MVISLKKLLKRVALDYLLFSMVGLIWMLAMGLLIAKILFLPQELEKAETKIVDDVLHNPRFIDRFGTSN